MPKSGRWWRSTSGPLDAPDRARHRCGTNRFEDVLIRTRFGAPRSVFLPGVPDLRRDVESILAGYFSLSWAATHLFGERKDAFAEEVRALLRSRSPDGVFWDWPGDTEVVLARKPT